MLTRRLLQILFLLLTLLSSLPAQTISHFKVSCTSVVRKTEEGERQLLLAEIIAPAGLPAAVVRHTMRGSGFIAAASPPPGGESTRPDLVGQRQEVPWSAAPIRSNQDEQSQGEPWREEPVTPSLDGLNQGTPWSGEPILLPLDNISRGENRRYLEIPVVQRPDSARFVLLIDGRPAAAAEVLLVPPRRWKVYDVQVSHHDLGYADYYHLMRRDVREMGLEMALEFCRRTDTWEPNARFHWTVETSEPMTRFISSQSPGLLNELAARIREGRIELGALHNSVSTEMLGPELMARLFYTPNRHIADLLDIPPARTALITDVVGFTRTMPLFLKEADIPFFYHGYNETINGLFPASAQPIFFWKANDGDSLEMPLLRSYPYYSPDRLVKYSPEEVSRLLAKYEANPLWHYDCLLAADSYDFSLPQFENVEGIKAWNEAYSNPELISGTFTMFFAEMKRQMDPGQVPTFAEDAPNAWADQDASDAALLAEARRLNYDLPGIETLATLVYAAGGKGYPWKEIWQSYHKLLSYHEHTNAAFSEEDVQPIPLLQERKAANANYYECERVMHKRLVSEARSFAAGAQQGALTQLAGLVTTHHDQKVLVYNPLSFARSGMARLAAPPPGAAPLVDNLSGAEVATQRLPDGRLLFAVADVPPLGYKSYHFLPGRSAKQSQSPDPFLSATTAALENARYRIALDPQTGAIASLFDKQLGVELVDQKARFGLNQYLYQRIEDPASRVPAEYTSRLISAEHFNGPLAAGISARLEATGCVSLQQSVILYANSDRIDFNVQFDKSPSGRLLKQPDSRGKEALFYALPFRVPGFTIRHGLAGGVVEPLAQQFSGSTSNFFAIQHFADLSNAEYGITLTSPDAPLIEYGHPRPALWNSGSDVESIIKKPEQSHCFLYLMNNMFFTNILLSQPGEVSFSWSLRAHPGDWRQGGAPRFGWETSQPLQTILIPEKHDGILPAQTHRFIDIDRDNVICSTIKPAEANGEGFILRFLEIEGIASKVRVRLDLFPGIVRALETNLIEADEPAGIVVTKSNELTFSIRPHGIKTIRVIPAGEPPAPPQRLSARALSDRSVALRWDAPRRAGVSHYRIYRGTSAAFAPSLLNCVASVSGSNYTDAPILNYGGWLDNKLEPDTDYYYRIEAVDNGNRASRFGEAVRARTRSSAAVNSPPNRVEGLEAVHVSPISDFNYLCLFFYTNCESDVTRYRLYRSERPGFMADDASLLQEIDATRKYEHITPHAYATVTRALGEYSMIVVPDESVKANKRYYYRAAAVDAAGQQGPLSEEVTGLARVSRLKFAGSQVFYDSARVEIQPLPGDGSQIRYTLDGSVPTAAAPLYTAPFVIREPLTVRAGFFPAGQERADFTSEAAYRRSLYAPPRYLQPHSEKWPGQGPLTLVDGQHGSIFADGCFQGFEFNDLDVIVDLGSPREISHANITMLQDIRSWIFFPEKVEFWLSIDGSNFTSLGEVTAANEYDRLQGSYIKEYRVEGRGQPGRYLRVKAINRGLCPPWHSGYELKGKAWIFADEILVDYK